MAVAVAFFIVRVYDNLPCILRPAPHEAGIGQHQCTAERCASTLVYVVENDRGLLVAQAVEQTLESIRFRVS
jgi:hypothetical protein